MTQFANTSARDLTKPVKDAIAAALPAIVMDSRRAAASIVIGEHGKRCAGNGEAFWQYRDWTNGESVRQIDWRRSARSDKLFVRERERQVPALLQIWCDTRPDMDWRGDTARPTKAHRAIMLGLSLAIATRSGGERVASLGQAAPFRDELTFAISLLTTGKTFPDQIRPGQVLLISDGLEDAQIWAKRAQLVSLARASLIVLLVGDPSEATFPYEGRTRFQSTSGDNDVVIGRAQSAQSAYVEAYQLQLGAVTQAIVAQGGQVYRHTTSAPTAPILQTLAGALDRAAPSQRVA